MAVAIFTSFAQLLDNNGDPLNGATVTVYDAGTTDLRNIYSDTGLSIAASNPITLDSAGRHGMRYTAATAYKALIEWTGGSLTKDNIDPGVPLGTGILGLANGGTGGNDAASARASLGAVGTGDIEDLEEQVAALAGAAGSSEKTSIAVGATAQRPSSPSAGDIRWNTTTSEYEGYTSGWENFLLTGDVASQSEMEAASSAVKVVAPSVVKHHPGVAKAWGFITVTGGTPAVTAGYNVTSITDNGVGNYTINLTTAFSSADFAVVAMLFNYAGDQVAFMQCTAKATSSITIRAYKAQGSGNANHEAMDNSFFFMAFGDQ